MSIKILAVCGSPIKGGNCEVFTREALKAAEELQDVETELILLAGWYKTFRGCNHCNYCATKQKPDHFCAIDDQMSEVYPRILEADAIVLSTPAYGLRMTGLMANFIDRLRPLYHGRKYTGSLRNKVGAAIVVAFGRHAGVETTQLSIVNTFMMWGALPVTLGLWGPFGAGGLSSYGGEGKINRDDKHAVLKDEFGLKEAKMLCATEIVERARIIKAGKQVLGIENSFLKMYENASSSSCDPS